MDIFNKKSLLFVLIGSVCSLAVLFAAKSESLKVTKDPELVENTLQNQNFEITDEKSVKLEVMSFGGLREKRGFMSSDGKVVITPRYKDIISEFIDGLAIVDTTYMKPPKYFKADINMNPFGTSQVIDITGKVILQSKENERFLCHSEGYVVKEVISETYEVRAAIKKAADALNFPDFVQDEMKPKDENVLGGEEDEKYLSHKLVNIKTGKELIISPEIKYIECFHNGLASVGKGIVGLGAGMFMGEKNGYINKDGKIVIDLKYFSAANFESNGIASVSESKHAEDLFIDQKEQRFSAGKGKTVFNEGLAILYTENGKPTSTVIDSTGKVVFKLPPNLKFSWLAPANGFTKFSSGLIPVEDIERQKAGYVNRTGEVVIPVQLGRAEPFFNGIGKIGLSDGRSALINAKGKIIWEEP